MGKFCTVLGKEQFLARFRVKLWTRQHDEVMDRKKGSWARQVTLPLGAFEAAIRERQVLPVLLRISFVIQ